MPRTDAAPLTDAGLKALSPAELEYMNIIWQHPDGMSSEVLYGFFPNHALKTKRVILHNIIKKGYLKSERIGRHQKYFSVVSASDYNKALEKHSFIKKYGHSFENIAAAFCGKERLSEDQVDRLYEFLEELREQTDE